MKFLFDVRLAISSFVRVVSNVMAPASRLLGFCVVASSLCWANLPDNVESSFHITKIKDLAGRILFVAEIAESKHIFTADLDSQSVARLMSDDYSNYSPQISPDGKQIVFISNRVNPPQLFLADWNGENLKRLTFSPYVKSYPVWSSDGAAIYFSGESGEGEARKSNIYMVRLDDSKEVKVTSLGQRNASPAPHPDLRTVAYTTNRFWPGWDVCMWDLTSEKESCVMSGNASFVRPRFSPDGTLLAMMRIKGQISDIGTYSYLDGTKKTRFFPSEGRQGDYDWKDSSTIFFSERDQVDGPYKIKMLDLSSGVSRVIISSTYSMKELSWSAVALGSLEEMKIAKEFSVLKFHHEDVAPEDYVAPYIRHDID
jgi:Tol biopolymer transport system component